MAQEILYPNGDDSGWATGAYTDIDEGTDSPSDADMISTAADGEGEVMVLDLDDSALGDGDTITSVDIVVRNRESLPVGNIAVRLLIGGADQGSAGTTSSSNFHTDQLNVAGWNVDWTAAQLNGAQVSLTAAQIGMPSAEQFDVSALQVEVNYTPAVAGGEPPSAYMRQDMHIRRTN